MSHERPPAPSEVLVFGLAGSGNRRVDRVRPVTLEGLEAGVELVPRHEIGAGARKCAVEDEGSGPLGVGRSEERAQRSAFRDSQQRGSLRSDGIHHSPNVVHPLLQDRDLGRGHPVGQPGSALVEDDQPGERSQPTPEGGLRGVVPGQLDVGDPAGNEDEVDRPLADDLVGDVDLAALGISGLGSQELDS
jgi:hypothetical protein